MLLPTGSYANAVHVSLRKPETSVTNTGHCSEGGWEEVKMEEQRTDGQRIRLRIMESVCGGGGGGREGGIL